MNRVKKGSLFFTMAPRHSEPLRRKASWLLVQGVGHAIAIYLARNHVDLVEELGRGSPSPPGYMLRQITDWMRGHIADDFDLQKLASLAGLSKFHFHRLFERAVDEAPSRYHMNLGLSFLQPDQVKDSLHAYQLSKRGNSLRVMAEAWAANPIAPPIVGSRFHSNRIAKHNHLPAIAYEARRRPAFEEAHVPEAIVFYLIA